MTAPRTREQADPPSPPDRRPPRRGGSPSAEIYSAAGRLRGLVRSGRRAVLAAAGLTAIVSAFSVTVDGFAIGFPTGCASELSAMDSLRKRWPISTSRRRRKLPPVGWKFVLEQRRPQTGRSAPMSVSPSSNRPTPTAANARGDGNKLWIFLTRISATSCRRPARLPSPPPDRPSAAYACRPSGPWN